MNKFSKVSFLLGPAPIRRTLPYLQSGALILKDRVKIMEVHYNMFRRRNEVDKTRPKLENPHRGLHEFYFWYVPQIQYKNPNVQIVRFVDMNPNPFIRCWLEDSTDVIFECFTKTKEDILQQVTKILGKSSERLALESSLDREKQIAESPALFGFNRPRFCICEVPGHVPCSGTCALPKSKRGKYTQYLKEELEQWMNDPDAEEESEKSKMNRLHYYPVPIDPVVPRVEGLDKMELRKPLQRSTQQNPNIKEFEENKPKDYT
ncbi:hypothetical protein B4U79_11973 [Dinothrombium tinctorium]|uniref:Small ribosomal subunit protein mS25 n=1 Tax=Dinothrombium tinctorium TaxID=1965070 RepID=A0A3S3NVD5_9ACAR|nr:hypothetical protein B4U79_11973 [Dinothrombium tinctorium]